MGVLRAKGGFGERNAGERGFNQIQGNGNCRAYRFREHVSVIEGRAANGQKEGAFGLAGIKLDRKGKNRLGAHRVRQVRGEFAGGLNVLELNFPGRERSRSIEEKNDVGLADRLRQIRGPLLLYVANQGKLVAIVAASAAQDALRALQGHPLGKDARIIGRVTAEHPSMVVMRAPFGTTRIVDMLVGDQLPRIC